MNLLERCITDLRSARNIIEILKKQEPNIKCVFITRHALVKIRREINGLRLWDHTEEYRYNIDGYLTMIHGVRVCWQD